MTNWRQRGADVPEEDPQDGGAYGQAPYGEYAQTGFAEEEYAEYGDALDETHRFHLAMNVFDLISVLAGLAVILVLVAILVSLITWLQSDITQSFTLLTSQLG